MITKLEKRINDLEKICLNKDEHIRNQAVTIENLKGEIRNLNQQIKAKEDIQIAKESLKTDMMDIETRINNKLAEQSRKTREEKENTEKALKEIDERNKSKAPQREFDRLKQKVQELDAAHATERNNALLLRRNNTNNASVQREIDDDEDEEVLPKKLEAEVVVLMDSNQKHIKPNLFLRGKDKAKFLITFTTEQLISHAESIDMSSAKHIIVSTGTNNLDRQNPEQVVTGIIKGATILKQKYPDTNIYVNQLPPRKFTLKQETMDTNTALITRLPEEFHIIKQEDLREQHLDDDKHISRGAVKFFVANIKSKMREIRNDAQVGLENRRPENGNNRFRNRRQQLDSNNNLSSGFHYGRRNNNNSHPRSTEGPSATQYESGNSWNKNTKRHDDNPPRHQFRHQSHRSIERDSQTIENQQDNCNTTSNNVIPYPSEYINPRYEQQMKQMTAMIEQNNSMVRNVIGMYNPLFQLPGNINLEGSG